MANLNAAAVSVIVPTYCEEETIEDCLKSVANQEFESGRIESIVVDSHSPDDTRTAAKKWADRVIDLKSRGVGKARNAGARIAESPILLFLDADTLLATNFVAEMYQTFTDPRVVCVSGILRSLERLDVIDNLFAISHYGFLNRIAALTAHLGFPLFPSVCCGCRKSVFEKVGGFDEDLAVAEDITFSRKIGRVGKCAVNRKATAYTSVRRISKYGKMEMYSMYFKNYIRVFVLNQRPWVQHFPHARNV
jgi:glycosyltransferase involved in cell wall biosynthesis